MVNFSDAYMVILSGGQHLTIESLGRAVPAIATGEDSPAFEGGYDLYFMTCSEPCAAQLKAALEADIEKGRLR